MKAFTLLVLISLIPLVSKANDGVKLKVCPYYPEPLPNERKVYDPPMEVATLTPVKDNNTITPNSKPTYKTVNVNVSIYIKIRAFSW